MHAAASDTPLRLKAEDAEDLEVISACLQDAIARVADMTFQPMLRRFAMVVTRFRWEQAGLRPEGGSRVRAGLHFDGVLQVRTRGIDMQHRDGLLPLLAVECEPRGEDVLIRLDFAGGGAVQLLAEYIDCHVQDLGESWPTPNRPAHDAGDG